MDILKKFIAQMPKVELHVHLEGSVQPETLLKLAKRHHVSLPADNIEGLRQWYTFRNFDHFVEIYMAISDCLRTAEDIELITRQFLTEQAAQNIPYSEVTFTPYNQFHNNQLGFHEQIDAVNRAREWAEATLNVRMGVIIDIPRHHPLEAGMQIANWVTERYGDGVIALGLGGPEVGNPVEKFKPAFERVRVAGIPCILHAGETAGPESIWEALKIAGSRRIGHGVRAIEDPELMAYLADTQIPLEVCLSSNIRLKIFESYAAHSLPQLMRQGLNVTINSDDPPMFSTTLTNEFIIGQRYFHWDRETIQKLVMNAVNATLLPEVERQEMQSAFQAAFDELAPTT